MVSPTGRLRAGGVEVALDASDPPEIVLRLALARQGRPSPAPPGHPPALADRAAAGAAGSTRAAAPAHAAARRAGPRGAGARAARLRAVPRVRDLRRLGRRQPRPRTHGRARLDPGPGPHLRAAGAAGGRWR